MWSVAMKKGWSAAKALFRALHRALVTRNRSAVHYRLLDQSGRTLVRRVSLESSDGVQTSTKQLESDIRFIEAPSHTEGPNPQMKSSPGSNASANTSNALYVANFRFRGLGRRLITA